MWGGDGVKQPTGMVDDLWLCPSCDKDVGGGIDGVAGAGGMTDWRRVIKYTRNHTQYDDDIDETCHNQRPFDDGYRNMSLAQRRFCPSAKFPVYRQSSRLSGDCHIGVFCIAIRNLCSGM